MLTRDVRRACYRARRRKEPLMAHDSKLLQPPFAAALLHRSGLTVRPIFGKCA